MTAKEKYRKYLQSDHWKQLSARAKERDGGCVVCASKVRLQVHHKKYRKRWEDALLEDLETLCIDCHRKEHGFGPDEFARKWYEIRGHLWHQKRPPKALWFEFKAMMYFDFDTDEFAELMYEYVICLAFEREKQSWWMDNEKDRYWRERAKRVKQLIISRPNRGVSAD